MGVIGFVDQPAADDRDHAGADQECAPRAWFSGRLSTTVATIGETAAQPSVVTPQAPRRVSPLLLFQPFQRQSLMAK